MLQRQEKNTHLADYMYVLYKFGLFRGSLETRNYIETAVDVLDFFCAFPSSRRDPFCPLLRLQNQKGVGGQKSIGQDHHLSIGVFSQVREWRGG